MKIATWFQIPAVDIDRAQKFYGEVFHLNFHRIDHPTGKHAFLSLNSGTAEGISGEIIQSPDLKPGADGVLIYFNAPDGIEAALQRALACGGKLKTPKASIGENGFIAVIVDSEGNQIGLHSMI